MALEHYTGLMVQSMKAAGIMILQMVMDVSYTQMETIIKEIGKTEMHMERGISFTLMLHATLAIG